MPRHTGQERQQHILLDNVYDPSNLIQTEVMTQEEWQKLMEGDPAPFPVVPLVSPAAPAESSPPESSPPLSCLRAVPATSSYPSHKSLTVLAQEGGVGFINYLLTLAISPDDSSLLPTISQVREWHFQDILKFPKKENGRMEDGMSQRIRVPSQI